MIDVYLFGTNSVAQVLAAWLKSDPRYSLRGYTVSKEYLTYNELDGYPVISLESINFNLHNIGIINCVGYSNQLENRMKAHTMLNALPIMTYVHPNAVVDGTDIGKGNVIMANTVIEKGSKIGEGNLFYGGVYVCHDAVIGNYNWFSAGSVLAGHCTIGNMNFIGINSCIREHTKIGSNTIVGAGAVIIKDIADNCTIVGNPGRIHNTKSRDKEI